MVQQTIQNSSELSKKIKQRRIELGLTIEEAASKAGVGTKTWSRYENGGAIRQDKRKGICRALNWHTLSEQSEQEDKTMKFDLDEYRKHDSYSSYLEDTIGPLAAVSFVVGSDILLDNISQDIEALSSMPKGSHIGQLEMSFLASELPPQFLMEYDYEFLLTLRSRVSCLCRTAHRGDTMIAHSVIDELALYLIMEESAWIFEITDFRDTEFQDDHDTWEGWVFDLFDDEDILTFLYSDVFIPLPTSHSFHFSHWLEKQFWMEE